MSNLGSISEKAEILEQALILASENKAFLKRIRNKLKAKRLNQPYDPNEYEYSYASWEDLYSQSAPEPIEEDTRHWGSCHY